MKFFNGDDYEVRYNKGPLLAAINEAEQIVRELCGNINGLVDSITELELNAHDKEGTRVDENYKDYQELLGDSSLPGLLDKVSKHLDELKEEMDSYEKCVERNQERRRRQEEERRRRLSSFRF